MNRRFIVSIIICIVMYSISIPIINKLNYMFKEAISPNEKILLMENKLKAIELEMLNLKSDINDLKKKGQ